MNDCQSDISLARRSGRILIDWHIDQALRDIDTEKMYMAAQAAAEKERVAPRCSVSVRICDDDAMRLCNRELRGIDRTTDVLSFPTVSYPPGVTAGRADKLLKAEYDDDSGTCFLGDIIISLPRIKAQAEEYGHSLSRESSYILVHGLLHLFGYDHIKDEDRMIMRRMEESIMDACHISRT